MKTISTLDPLKTFFPSIHKALVLMSSTPNLDSVAAALGLAEILKKKQISVQVACPVDMRVEFSRLVGVDEVKKKVGNRNLVISFPCTEESVEKVSYVQSEDKTRFDLIIAPKNGSLPPDPSLLSFDYTGAEADATFLVGVNTYQDLGDIYEAERNVIEGSMTIAFTLFPVGTYAKVHADAGGYSSLCEMVAGSCQQLGLTLEHDSASNFLFGIESVTQGLAAPTVTADTFEMVAALMRAGASRQPIGQQGTLSPHQFPFDPQSSINTPAPVTSSQPPVANNNPFAAALSKTSQSSVMPAGYSATGELKG